MLTLVLMVALVLIALTAELPKMVSQIRHDREEELIHRGAQYSRAIKKYYKKFGAYPVRVEQLEDTNHLRFLRKRYKDPMTGQDFRLLHFGDVQLSTKLPGMTTGPGIAPGSGITGSPFSGSPGFNVPSPTQPSSGQPTNSPVPDSQGSGFSTGSSGSSSSSSSPSSSSSSSSSASSSSSSLTGGKGQTFGGGPIIGVASTSEKQSFHVFNQKDHYKDWEFIYDPTADRGALITGPYNGVQSLGGGQIPGAVSPGQMQPGGISSSPFGQPQSPFGQQQSPYGQQQTPNH